MEPGECPSSLETIAFKRPQKRKRLSSYDRSGGNDDRIHLQPFSTQIIADIDSPGIINHIWMTLGGEEDYLRKTTIRMYWDGEKSPSVEAPLEGFFGMGHAMCANFVSEPLNMSPADGKGFNCWFHMPFNKAKIELESECETSMRVYFYIDYEEYNKLPENMLRFHAKFNRENPTHGIYKGDTELREYVVGGQNTDGKENYVVLEAEGCGHYVGCNLNILNLRHGKNGNWPGEGDDMIFIDGEPWPPSLHGTGTEDYFNTAWCPSQEYNAPYHGIILPGSGKNFQGPITYCRYHIRDPIMFERSIKVTIEHGHNNHRSDDWSSTAYWYQSEPHVPFENYPDVKSRLPRK